MEAPLRLARLSPIALVLLIVAAAGCSLPRKPGHYVHGTESLLVISQSRMDTQMLKRVVDVGAYLCNSKGGLKSVTWPYNTTPRGPLSPVRGAKFVPRWPGSLESEHISQEMHDLAAAAPRPYVTVAPPNDYYVGKGFQALYLCADGEELPGHIYLLVP